jgi:hypothetical protein
LTLAFASTAAGLALLGKPEIGQASYAMLACALVLEAVTTRAAAAVLRKALVCLPGVAIWIIVYGWFLWRLSIRLVLDNWIGPPGPYFFEREGARLYGSLGFRFIPVELVILAIGGALSLLIWFGLARSMVRRAGAVWLTAAVGVQIGAAFILPPVIGASTVRVQVFEAARSALFYPRSMFFVGLMFLLWALFRVARGPIDRLLLAQALFDIFALFCALRVFAQIDPFGYAIYYVPPLFLIFLIVVAKITRYATARSGDREVNIVNVIMAAEIIMLVFILFPGRSARTTRFITTWGEIYTTPGDAKVGTQIMEFMLAQKKEGQRVVILPEAPMFYAFAGMEAPDRWYTFLPGFRSPDQQREYIEDLERANPKYILLTDRSFEEYGTPHFGIDFDQVVYRWIVSHYHEVSQFGRFQQKWDHKLAALVYQRDG